MKSISFRERFMGVGGCACVGGFVTSSLGHYLGAFPGMDLVGAVAFAAFGTWADAR